jgi:uncharacterized protein (TIGR03437 family)
MKRLLFFAVAQILMGAAWAQSDIVSVRVDAQPCGRFSVDGQSYDRVATFLWPVGSQHTLVAAESFPVATGVMCEIGGWTVPQDTPPADGKVLSITVPGPVEYALQASYSYRVMLNLVTTGGLAFSCDPGAGNVTLNGGCYAESTTLWLAGGTNLVAMATPPPGWAFSKWSGNVPGGSTSPFLSLVVNGPLNLTPQFVQAAQIVVTTDPPGLLVMGDNTRVKAPYIFYWAPGTTHALGPVSPQTNPDNGDQWVFVSWSEGGPVDGQFTVPTGVSPINLTATYARGTNVSFATDPRGLKLVIDGISSWPHYNFAWATGSTHTISAPLMQTGSDGREYVFRSWSNGGDADQIYTVGAVGVTASLIASYDVLGQLQVQASPSDVNAVVGGSPCVTPCVVNKAPGEQVTVSVPQTVAIADGARLDFAGWSDGVSTPERVWTSGTALVTFRANYTTSYRVTVAADPAGSGSFTFSPASADGYFLANTNLTITENARTGYKFSYWAGDFESPLASSVTVVVSGPLSLSAVFVASPNLAVDGVRNAAGETPEQAVAAGSIISIVGDNLAPSYEKGPDSPLTQTLVGGTVQVNDRYLPLVFVSPSRIDAQLFSDMPAGDYTLTVHQDGQPDVSGNFTIQRNAPGLFNSVANPTAAATADILRTLLHGQPVQVSVTQAAADQPYALAFHQDGTPVTPDSPAVHGETITLLGTGFGPFQPVPLDGFAVPSQPAGLVYTLVDPVEVRVLTHPALGAFIKDGPAEAEPVVPDVVLTPVSVQAAKGYVGTTAVALTIGSDLPSATTVKLWVAVKDPADPEGQTFHESNTVLLPLQ